MSAEFIFPPHPKFNCSNAMTACVTSDSKMVVAYVSKYNVVVMKVSETSSRLRPTILSPWGEFIKEKEETMFRFFLVSVAIVCEKSKSGDNKDVVTVACGSGLGNLGVWTSDDIEHGHSNQPLSFSADYRMLLRRLRSRVTSQKLIPYLHCSPIACLEFLQDEQDMKLASSVANSACVVLWDYKQAQGLVDEDEGVTKRFDFGFISISCMKRHPSESNCLALGLENGDVLFVLLKDFGHVVKKFISDDDGIVQAISWRPRSNDDDEEEEDLQLLAVANGEGRVTVYNEESEQSIVDWMAVPDFNEEKTEMCLEWWQRDCLFTPNGYLEGSLMLWDVSRITFEPKRVRLPSRSVHNEHFNSLQSIAAVPNSPYIITLGYDRKLAVYNTESQSVALRLPTFTRKVSCITQSPVDPHLIAIGADDVCIRVWRVLDNGDQSENDINYINLPSQTIVTHLAFHPKYVNELVFATTKGQVGLLDATEKFLSSHKLFSHNFETPLSKLVWGPSTIVTEDCRLSDPYSLFCLHNGKVYVHKTLRLHKKPLQLHLPDHESGSSDVSEIAFSSDFNYLAVGKESGNIEVYSASGNHLELLIQLESINSEINALQFNVEPNANGHSQTGKAQQIWLAALSDKEKNVHIFKLENYPPIEKEEIPKISKHSHAILEGHSEGVLSLCWNPRKREFLATTSIDKTAKVWNCSTGQCMATYSGHDSIARCCQWSPQDEHIVFTTDETLHAWDYRKQPANHVPIRFKEGYTICLLGNPKVFISKYCPKKETQSKQNPST